MQGHPPPKVALLQGADRSVNDLEDLVFLVLGALLSASLVPLSPGRSRANPSFFPDFAKVVHFSQEKNGKPRFSSEKDSEFEADDARSKIESLVHKTRRPAGERGNNKVNNIFVGETTGLEARKDTFDRTAGFGLGGALFCELKESVGDGMTVVFAIAHGEFEQGVSSVSGLRVGRS